MAQSNKTNPPVSPTNLIRQNSKGDHFTPATISGTVRADHGPRLRNNELLMRLNEGGSSFWWRRRVSPIRLLCPAELVGSS